MMLLLCVHTGTRTRRRNRRVAEWSDIREIVLTIVAVFQCLAAATSSSAADASSSNSSSSRWTASSSRAAVSMMMAASLQSATRPPPPPPTTTTCSSCCFGFHYRQCWCHRHQQAEHRTKRPPVTSSPLSSCFITNQHHHRHSKRQQQQRQQQHNNIFKTTVGTAGRTTAVAGGVTTVIHRRSAITTAATATTSSDENAAADERSTTSTAPWLLNQGLLISSFTDGVIQKPTVRQTLVKGLVRAWLKQHQHKAETNVAASVKFSPCAGPDITSLDTMELIDRAIERLDEEERTAPIDDNLLNEIIMSSSPPLVNDSQQQQSRVASSFRVAFIPTAMYALNPDSTNSPGKQRQRFRADAKQRRNRLVRVLQEDLSSAMTTAEQQNVVAIQAVTIDLADGSAKQPEVVRVATHQGAEGASATDDGDTSSWPEPKTAYEALTSWRPHLVYVQGGNTFWLTHCVFNNDNEQHGTGEEETCWSSVIRDLVRDGQCLYIGQSAGAILAGARVETACWKGWDDPRVVPGRDSYDAWKGATGLGLCADQSFFPHMDDEWVDVVDSKLSDADNGLTTDNVICIRDDEAYWVDGTKQRLLPL